MRTARAVSAGGVVLSEPAADAQVALIARRSAGGALQWTLPKGTQEARESIPDTALREVREETGLEVELLTELRTIDYWFVWNPEQTRYHKFVHYYLMRATGGDLSRHDSESEDARWFPIDYAGRVMAFDNERYLLDLVPAALRRWSADR
jgi:8-oxo-dGTP pyrophosphatase MutT (NUDIX family)